MPASRAKRSATSVRPLLSAVDFERHLRVHSAAIAPADVTALVGQASALRARLTGERAVHPMLADRAGVALQLLADHCHGACPQIPYSTVSLLASGLPSQRDVSRISLKLSSTRQRRYSQAPGVARPERGSLWRAQW